MYLLLLLMGHNLQLLLAFQNKVQIKTYLAYL